MKFPVLGILCSGVLAAASGATQAAIIEQSSGGFGATIASFDPIGQSFVAEDSLLGAIAFAFRDANPTFPNDPITMTLYSGSGFGGVVLATVTQTLPAVLPDSPGLFIDFDFTGTVLVVGNIYTAAVMTASSYKVGVTFNGTDAYAGGQAFESSSSLNLPSCSAGCDLNFRVTPAVSAVPLPAAVWLFGSGLLGLVGLSRKRRG